MELLLVRMGIRGAKSAVRIQCRRHERDQHAYVVALARTFHVSARNFQARVRPGSNATINPVAKDFVLCFSSTGARLQGENADR